MFYLDELDTDGWHVKVGQIYSSSYHEYHIKIVKIYKEDNDDLSDDVFVEFHCLEPMDYTKEYREYSKDNNRFRVWYLNDTWGLEEDTF
jgi:hypothetical protein